MTVWVLAKPRLRFHDAIDLFVSRLAELRDSQAFVMKMSYVSNSHHINHDDLFSRLMDEDAAEDAFVREFFEIFNSQTVHSKFSPLVTNRLLTPILPRSIEPGAAIRRRLRNRLDNLLSQLANRFRGKLKCLIMLPNADDFAASVRFNLMIEAGYTSTYADAIMERLQESLQFGEYKIKQSDAFDEVQRVVIPTGASFAYLYVCLRNLGIPLPQVISSGFLKPGSIFDFHLIEAIMSPQVRDAMLSARPSQHSRARAPYSAIVEALTLSSRPVRKIESRLLEAVVGDELDISKLTLPNALRLDEASRQHFLWHLAGDEQ
jgi:hypothetical protein